MTKAKRNIIGPLAYELCGKPYPSATVTRVVFTGLGEEMDFTIGQCVVSTSLALKNGVFKKQQFGKVVKINFFGQLKVHRDGFKRPHGWFHPSFWAPVRK